MATREAIGLKRAVASQRLAVAMDSVSGRLGIPVRDIPKIGRDPNLLAAQQLEAFALWCEDIAQALGASVDELSGYAQMTEEQLVRLGTERQVAIAPTDAKEDLVDALEADDERQRSKFSDMTVPELIEYAAQHDIDLTDARRKAEIVDKITAQASKASV